MSAEKMIKKEAKAMLSKNWPSAVMALLVLIFIPMISGIAVLTAYDFLGESDVSSILHNEPVRAVMFVLLHILAVVSLVLLSPLYNGFVRFYSKAACGGDAEMSDVFHFFESKQLYKSAVIYMAGVLVRCLGILLVCEAPAIAVAAISADDIYDNGGLQFIVISLAVIGFICNFLWLHRFALQMMLFSHYDYDGVSAAKEGMLAAKGNIGKLIKLSFSFILWMLSTFFIVPLLYVCPYMTCSYFVSAKYIIANYLERKNAEPVMPSQPEQFVQPEAPVQTEQYVQPEAPVQPEQYVQPEAPVQPEQYVQPEAPVQPEQYVQPETPVQTEQYVQPEAPVQTEQYVQPEAPVQTEQYVQPETPVQTEQYVQPETPVQTEQYVQPETPVQTEQYIQPEQTAAGEVSENRSFF